MWAEIVRFLGLPWWQGVAGLAQIAAGVFAVITIWQARKTIKQSDKAMRRSAASRLVVVHDSDDCPEQIKGTPKRFGVLFAARNEGPGAAYHV